MLTRRIVVAAKLVETPDTNEQIAEYLRAFWPALPEKHIRMNASGPKYAWVKDAGDQHVALSYADLLAHARGEQTIGAHLHNAAGLCRVGMLDPDQGGRTSLVAALRAAHQLGYTAYGIYSPAGIRAGAEHDGGRLVVHFDSFTDWHAIRAVMEQIRDAAGLPADTEIWPGGGNAIALPFGVHLRKGTRGELLTQDGETIALDTQDGLSTGVDVVLKLRPNDAPPPVQKVEMPRPARATTQATRRISPGEAAAERMSNDEIAAKIRDVTARTIAKFKAENTLESLLAEDGAEEIRTGYYSCPHCAHTHDITLYITDQGRLFSLSPQCLLHTTKGYDELGYYIKTRYNDNFRTAIDALSRDYGFWFDAQAARAALKADRQADPPLVEPPDYLTKAAAEKREKDRQRKNEVNAAEAAQIRESVEAHAAADATLPKCEQAVIGAMLAWAAEHNSSSCWLGRASLARLTGYSLGSVKRAVMELERRGYFESSGKGGRPIDTARRNFSRGSLLADTTICVAKDDPRIDLIEIDLGNLRTSERGAEATPDENAYAPASELDEWECSEAPIGDDVLIWLAEQDVIRPVEQASVVVEPPAIVFVSTPDARGMELVRWSDGKVTWRKETSRELEKQHAADNTGGSGSRAGERTTVQPAIAAAVERPGDSAAAAGRVEPQGGAEAEACYDIAADWTAPKRGRKLPKPPKIKAMDTKRRQHDRWRRMDIPELRREMYALRGKANKPATQVAQRDVLLGQARDIEYMLAVKEAARGVPVEPDDGSGDGVAVQARPLTSSRGIATEQAVFAGV